MNQQFYKSLCLNFNSFQDGPKPCPSEHSKIVITCPLSKALLRNSAHPWCNGASKQIQVVILWTLCSLLAFLKYAVKMPSSKSEEEFTLPNMSEGSDTPRGFILCSLWVCIWEPVFLCLISEHSLRVSTSPEMQDDFPVPGGPATMIPREVKSSKTDEIKGTLSWF